MKINRHLAQTTLKIGRKEVEFVLVNIGLDRSKIWTGLGLKSPSRLYRLVVGKFATVSRYNRLMVGIVLRDALAFTLFGNQRGYHIISTKISKVDIRLAKVILSNAAEKSKSTEFLLSVFNETRRQIVINVISSSVYVA